MKKQSAILNIRYDWPIWDYRIKVIYSKTDGWIPDTNRWFNITNEDKYVTTSLEPAGLLFYGQMGDHEWNKWLADLKAIASIYLGIQIGELESGEITESKTNRDINLDVIHEFPSIYSCGNDQKICDYLFMPKPYLAELEEIEIEKYLFSKPNLNLHDQIAATFQYRSHPLTAKFIFDQIQGGQIPEFDYKPVTRRCTWALADIGTQESKQYLEELSKSSDKIVQGFAEKRLENWERELPRKGRKIPANFSPKDRIKLQAYLTSEASLPQTGNWITAYQYEDSIVVYQAYKESIADYAVKHQKFGGSDFSFNRMTWIKPNYLWMMYRSGWASKEGQEKILAIRITKQGWDELLANSVISSYNASYYESHVAWQRLLDLRDVRLQWDPNHDPFGNKLERKAIQIGIKGELLKKFNTEMILAISDITPFVHKQRIYVQHQQLQYLEIPIESIYTPNRSDINIGISF